MVRPSNRVGGLTLREWEVLHLIARGYTYRSIAERLVISHLTAKKHARHICEGLLLHNQAQMAAWYENHRDLEPPFPNGKGGPFVKRRLEGVFFQ